MCQLARWASPKPAAAVPGAGRAGGMSSGRRSRPPSVKRSWSAVIPAVSVSVKTMPTVVTLEAVASVYVARRTRRQPAGRRASARRGRRASAQAASGATAIRAQVRSAPPGPRAVTFEVRGKRVSTGVLCQRAGVSV